MWTIDAVLTLRLGFDDGVVDVPSLQDIMRNIASRADYFCPGSTNSICLPVNGGEVDLSVKIDAEVRRDGSVSALSAEMQEASVVDSAAIALFDRFTSVNK